MISGEITRSLRRSPIRLEVLKYLNSIYPDVAYMSEIAKEISSTPTNVFGCLKGLGKDSIKYADDLSLLSLGLVELVAKRKKKYYRIKNKEKVDEIVLMFPVKQIVEVEE